MPDVRERLAVVETHLEHMHTRLTAGESRDHSADLRMQTLGGRVQQLAGAVTHLWPLSHRVAQIEATVARQAARAEALEHAEASARETRRQALALLQMAAGLILAGFAIVKVGSDPEKLKAAGEILKTVTALGPGK